MFRRMDAELKASRVERGRALVPPQVLDLNLLGVDFPVAFRQPRRRIGRVSASERY
jgi:hypothetical protein